MKIHWNGFLTKAVRDYPNEVAGFLFSNRPYSSMEEWYVFSVKNIATDHLNAWRPEKKDMQKIKQKAIKQGLTKIGNIHTHPYPSNEPFNEDVLRKIIQPSKEDLRFARRFNDIIRGIVVTGQNAIYDILFHDKFGRKIDVFIEEVEK